MFTINRTNPDDFTVDNVRRLIASADDSANRQLRVLHDGTIMISDSVGSQNLENVKMRYETWIAGNGYSGEAAAKDTKWVTNVYNWLRDDWNQGKTGYIDW